MCKPDFVFVCPIKLTTTAWLRNGLPRQFLVMWHNIRCSILFHLLVPGGKWQIVMRNPVVSANCCKATFHNRLRYPLLPPASTVTSTLSALGYSGFPISHHQ